MVFTSTAPLRSLAPEILVVDDNEMNLTVMLHFVSKAGYTAQVARSGLEALELLEERDYPVILMDCHMPGLDGYETTACIRQREALRGEEARARIIAVTADLIGSSRERCIAAGMDDFLSKPLSPERFREVLAEALPGEEKWK